MATAIRVSDAAALGLHTMALLAKRNGKPMSAREIACALKASQAHLSKVLQQLAHAGMLHSERGPGGGFTLPAASRKLTLLQVYEAIEGPLAQSTCLLHTRLCSGRNCILGDLLKKVNSQMRAHLGNTTLEDV